MVKVPKSRIFFSFISCLLINTPAYSNPAVGVWNIVSTFVGSLNTPGYQEGTGSAARVNIPSSLAVDSSGTVYFADTSNYRIRKITSGGTTSLLAGGSFGYQEGTGAAAQFGAVYGIGLDSSGTVYVADSTNNRIRKISSGGTTSLLAGDGTAGNVNGAGTSSRFWKPNAVAVNSAGIAYVADFSNSCIRQIATNGTTSLLAGTGSIGYQEGTGAAAQFYYPESIAVDSSGTIYVADTYNNRIRKITSGGTTSLLAGGGSAGYQEGTGAAAQFNFPINIAVSSSGTVYVADYNNNRIRAITAGGVTSTLAGSSQGNQDNVPGAIAQFDRPTGVTIDNNSGVVYVSEYGASRIRKINPLQIYINTDAASAYSGLITLPGASTYTRMDSDTGGTINNASFALTFGKTDGTTVSSTFRGIIQGTGSLTINADAGKSLTLAGPSTYSGGTTVTSGILSLAHNTGAGTNTITYNGGSLQIGANAVSIGNAISLKSSASNSLNLNGFNATLSGVISGGNGSSTLAVTNSGGTVKTLTLSGNNTYTASTSIGSKVTLALNGSSTLGAGGLSFTDSTSTLDISATTAGITVTNLQSGAGNIALGAKTLTLNNTVDTSFNGTISDGGLSGAVTKSGANALTLGGANTYLGGTIITGGTISISAANNLGSSTSGVTFNGANTTLTVTSVLTLANPITLTTNGILNTQADVTASGMVSGTGILTKTGANTLTLTGASSFGGTTISAGTVTFSAAANVGTTVSLNGGKLQLAANATGAVTLASPSITASGGTIENLSAQPLTLTSASGTGALIKIGSGPLTLSGSSSRSGTTTVNAGALGVDHYQSLGSGNLTLAANTSLELSGNIGAANPVANAIAITGPVTVDSKGYTGYFNGPITGAQALTVQGSGGTVVLGGTNTPSSTTVTSGTLALLNSSSSFSNPVNVGSGATFDISQGPASPTLANITTVSGSNIRLGSQALSLTSGTIAGNLLDGGISGTTGATLTKTGGSTLTLTGTNTYAGGTSLQAGTININNIHALGSGALNYAIAGATLQIGAALAGAIPNDIILTADGNLDTQGYDVDLSGSVSGSATLHKLGSGMLTLSGANTYNGAQLLNGKVALGNNLGFGSGTVSFNTPGTELRIARTLSNVANPMDFTSDGIIDTLGNDATFSGTFSGPGKFTKNGVGKVRITNPAHPTFSGQMEINDGEVNLNGNMTNAPVVVNSGAKFTGNSTVAHLTNLGTVKPGNSIGVINIAGNFSNAGGVYNCEIDATPASDIINVGGTATLGGTLNVLPQPGNYSIPKTYTILTAVNPIVTTFDSVTSPSILLQYTLNYLPHMVQLTASQGSSVGRIITEGNPGIVAQYIDTLSPTSGSTLDNFLNVLPSLSINDIYKGLNQIHPAANALISSVVAANELNQTDGIFSSLLIERSLRRVRKYTTIDDKQSAQFGFAVTQANAPVVNEGLDSLFFTKPPASTVSLSPLPQPQAAPQNVRTSFGNVNIWFQQAVSNINHRSVSDGSPTIGGPGVKANLNSTSLGADTQITDQLLFGTTVGYSKISYNLRQKYGNGHISSYRFALYGMWTPKKEWYVNGSGFYGRHHFKGKRNLVLPSGTYRNRQRHLGHHYSGIVEVGRDIALPNQTILTPYGSVGGVALKEDGYKETEDGFNPSLKVKGRTSGFIQAKAGLQLSSLNKLNDVQVYVYAKLGYIYKNPLRKPQRVTASFVGYDGNFTVFANMKQQNMFNPGLGVTALFTDQLSLTASYTGEISPIQRLHQALVRLDYRF